MALLFEAQSFVQRMMEYTRLGKSTVACFAGKNSYTFVFVPSNMLPGIDSIGLEKWYFYNFETFLPNILQRSSDFSSLILIAKYQKSALSIKSVFFAFENTFRANRVTLFDEKLKTGCRG